jgi:hypothetical protein
MPGRNFSPNSLMTENQTNTWSVSLIGVGDSNEEFLTSINYTAQDCSISNIVGGFYLFQNYSNAVISDQEKLNTVGKMELPHS